MNFWAGSGNISTAKESGTGCSTRFKVTRLSFKVRRLISCIFVGCFICCTLVFPQQLLLSFFRVRLTLPSGELLNLSCEGDEDFLGDHRGTVMQNVRLTCNHRFGNSWAAIKALGALPASARSVSLWTLDISPVLVLDPFWAQIVNPTKQGLNTKKFSEQM